MDPIGVDRRESNNRRCRIVSIGMHSARTHAGVIALLVALFPGRPATPADLSDRAEDVWVARPLRLTAFDPAVEREMDRAESQFLVGLFALTDEAALLNADVSRWLVGESSEGLHPLDYVEDVDELRARLEGLPTPARLKPVRAPILECLGLQRDFIRDWFRAIAADEPFESQLTSEFAYHEGLHRSHRLLLKAFAELSALLPEAEETNRIAFQDHLGAMDLR